MIKIELFEQREDNFIRNEITMIVSYDFQVTKERLKDTENDNQSKIDFLNYVLEEISTLNNIYLSNMKKEYDNSGAGKPDKKNSEFEVTGKTEKNVPVIPAKSVQPEREREGKNIVDDDRAQS